MRIKSSEAKSKTNSEACTVKEYEFPFKKLGIATAIINGRYPDSGKVINRVCDEIYYVVSGNGVVHTEDGNFKITKGDAFYLEKSKEYWVEGNNLKIVLPTAPSWFQEQYEQLG